MKTPKCKIHGEMIKIEVTQGEGENLKSLGFIWFCKEKECDECEDYQEDLVSAIIDDFEMDVSEDCELPNEARAELNFYKQAAKQLKLFAS
jgi:hypothetical protein